MLKDVAVHVQYNIGVHLDETPIGVVGKALIATLSNDALNGVVIETEVEDCIHHSRHRGASTGTHRNQQWVLRVTKFFIHQLLDLSQILIDLILQTSRVVAVVLVELGADFRGKGETGRNRQADTGHFRQVGTLATQQIFHVTAPFGFAVTEEIDVLCHRCFLPKCDLYEC